MKLFQKYLEQNIIKVHVQRDSQDLSGKERDQEFLGEESQSNEEATLFQAS